MSNSPTVGSPLASSPSVGSPLAQRSGSVISALPPPSVRSNSVLIAPPVQPVISDVVKQGFLTKEGETYKNWKKRWFVLKGMQLSYFKKQTDKKPIKSLDLANCEVALCPEKENKNRGSCFSVKTAKRTFYFSADNDVDRNEWMNVLRASSYT